MPSFSTFINWCLDICNDPLYGYSMDFRENQALTYSEAVAWDNKASGFAWNYHYDFTNFAGTDATIHYFDCSSYVSYALKAAGFSNNVFSTSEAKSTLKGLGWIQLDNGNNLEQGDIGLYRNEAKNEGHIEICYRGGVAGKSAVFMGAHGRRGKTSSPPYDLPYQVSIGSTSGNEDYCNDEFTMFFRYNNWDDSTPIPEVKVDPISDILIYALCGNGWQESGINPARWEGGVERSWNALWSNNTGGYGIWQFTNTSSENMELEDLWTYVNNENLDIFDGYAQCIYLQSGEATSQHWWYASDMYDASSVTCHTWDSWCNDWNGYSDDLWQMTYDFFRCWEGIHDGTENVRYEYAQRCQDYVPQHLEDESITDWIYGNRSLNENEILNNAVMLFRSMQTIHGSSGNYTPNYPSDKGNGDSGYNGTKEELITWENFLMSGLAKDSKSGLYLPLHIINKRRV